MSKIEKTCTFGEVSLKLYVFPPTWNILPFCSVIAPRIGYYPGKRVTSVLLHEEWMYTPGKAEGNKTDVTRFPG